jgi:hypothetical protein
MSNGWISGCTSKFAWLSPSERVFDDDGSGVHKPVTIAPQVWASTLATTHRTNTDTRERFPISPDTAGSRPPRLGDQIEEHARCADNAGITARSCRAGMAADDSELGRDGAQRPQAVTVETQACATKTGSGMVP